MTPRKTAQEISDLIIAQLETSLSTTIPLLPKSFCRVLSKVLGGVFVLLFNFAGWTLMQMFPKTASNEDVTINGVTVNPLRAWGELAPGGPVVQSLGVKAERTIEITVLVQGGTLTSGQRVVNPATEKLYTLVGDVSLSSSTVTGVVRAVEAGDVWNVDAGETLNLVSPPSSVEKEVTVTGAAAVLGVDPETTEQFRAAVIGAWAARPQGGAYADYRRWAEEVPGVTNAYPYSGWTDYDPLPGFPSGGPGFVFVFIEASAYTDGIPPELPGGTLLQSVDAAIKMDVAGLATRCNINAFIRVKPITRTAISVTVKTLYSDEDTDDVKDAIEEALTEYFLDRAPFILGLDMPPRKDIITKSSVGGVVAFVTQAMGAAFSEVVISVGGSEVEVYSLQEGEKAKLGTLNFA